MRFLPRLWPLMLGLLLALPGGASAQDDRIAALERRVVQRESLVSQLNDRILQLEAQLRSLPPETEMPTKTGDWRDRSNRRQLERGMSMEDVTTLIGEPDRVQSSSIATYWTYIGDGGVGRVQFDERGRVDGWTEP